MEISVQIPRAENYAWIFIPEIPNKMKNHFDGNCVVPFFVKNCSFGGNFYFIFFFIEKS